MIHQIFLLLDGFSRTKLDQFVDHIQRTFFQIFCEVHANWEPVF